MELRHLRYFKVVAEEEHVGRAAEKLQMAQPPLSSQIQKLEQELGFPLFERVGRGIRLLPAGGHFLNQATRILEQVEIAIAETRAIHRGESGHLSVGLSDTLAQDLVATAVNRYRSEAADVNLAFHEMSTVEQIESLLSGRIDVAFICTPSDPDDFCLNIRHADEIRYHTLGRDKFVLAMAKGHPLAGTRVVPFESLADESFSLISEEAGPGLRHQFLNFCRTAGFEPEVIFHHSHGKSGLSFVASGLAIELVPSSYASSHHNGVVFRPIAPDSLCLEIRAAWNATSRNPALPHFLEVLGAQAGTT